MKKRSTIGIIGLATAVAVCLVNSVAANTFADGFETYTPGSYPANGWSVRFAGSAQQVSADQALSGNQSFYMHGVPGFSAESYVPMTSGSMPDAWIFSGAMRLASSLPDITDQAGLSIWYQPTANRAVGISIYRNGNELGLITRGGEIIDPGLTLERDQWYSFDFVVDELAQEVDYYMNGTLIAAALPVSAGDPQFGSRLTVHAGHGVQAYFDDISLLPEPAAGLLVMLGIMTLRRR
jgi:hypothetical protein